MRNETKQNFISQSVQATPGLAITERLQQVSHLGSESSSFMMVFVTKNHVLNHVLKSGPCEWRAGHSLNGLREALRRFIEAIWVNIDE